jgi:hypothetical protein
MANQQHEMMNVLNQINAKGLFSFVAVTTKEALKKSRFTKQPTPSHLTKITVVRACTVSLGYDYEEVVNARLSKEDAEAEFIAGGSYCYPVTKNRLIFKHKDRDVYYLRVYPNIAKSFKSIVRYYDADGIEILADEFKMLEKEYFAIRSHNENQGLEDPVLVNNYKIENVKYLKRGDVFINHVDDEIIHLIHGLGSLD